MIKRDFRKQGYPKNREEFTIFADKFGIPISTSIKDEKSELQIRQSEYAKEQEQSINQMIPQLASIPAGTSQGVDTFLSLASELAALEGVEAHTKMQEMLTFLVGADWKSGELDNILADLQQKDRENAQAGIKSNYLQTFARAARDFSPQVA